MSDQERLYRERSRALFDAAKVEQDPTLRLALYKQSERIGHKALRLELERKQDALVLLGEPLTA